MNFLKRRQFLANLSKAGLLGTLHLIPSSGFANKRRVEKLENAKPESEGAHSFLTAPYLQNPSPTSMNVMWLTNKLCYSWVEYGEAGQLNKKMHAVTDGLVNAYNRINNVCLQNLKPATNYSYRVLSKEIVDTKINNVIYGETINSETYHFTTPQSNPKEVSWLMFNDIHDRPETIPHLLKVAGNDPYDFIFFNGDIFNQQDDEKQIIDHMLAPCTKTFASNTPFLMVRGNHETRGKYSRELCQYFANKDNSYYNAFTWGPIRFVVIDTGEDKEDNHAEYGGLASFDEYRIMQAKWVEKEMQSKVFKASPFRVVLMHIPHFYANGWHGPEHCRELFGPLFNKYKVDISISGHTHKYGLFDPVAGKHNYPIIIGGGPKDGNRTITKLKADAHTLSLSMLRDDGIEVGNYIIHSKK